MSKPISHPRLWLAALYIATYGFHLLWDGETKQTQEFMIWQYRAFALACFVAAAGMLGRLTWARHVAYVLAVLTVYSSVSTLAYLATIYTPYEVFVSALPTTLFVLCFVASAFAAHRVLRPATA